MHAAVTGCHCGTTLRKYSIKGCPGEVTHGDRVLFAHHTALDRAYRSAYRIEVDARLTRPVPPAVRVPPPQLGFRDVLRAVPATPGYRPARGAAAVSANRIRDSNRRSSTLRAPSCVYRYIGYAFCVHSGHRTRDAPMWGGSIQSRSTRRETSKNVQKMRRRPSCSCSDEQVRQHALQEFLCDRCVAALLTAG